MCSFYRSALAVSLEIPERSQFTWNCHPEHQRTIAIGIDDLVSAMPDIGVYVHYTARVILSEAGSVDSGLP